MIWKNNLLTALHCCISYNCKKSSASNENLPTMVWIVFWGGITKRFPWWFRAACNVEDLGLILGSRRSLGEGNDNPLMFLPGESHGQRSLVGYSPWGHKESDTTEQLSNTTGEIMAKSLSLLKSVIGELWGRVVWLFILCVNLVILC